MKMTRERLVVIAVALIFGVGIVWNVLEGLVAPAGVVSTSEIVELVMTADGNRVEQGWLVATLVVESREEMVFSLSPEVIGDIALSEDPSKNIPPGSELRFEGGISVVLKPEGNPYVHGPVWERGFVYDDHGDPSTDRLWWYYSLAHGGWTARHVPYQIRVTDDETEEVLVPWTTFVSGYVDGWDVGTEVDLARGIKLLSLGELLNGVPWPSEDWAFISNVVDGTVVTQYVSEDDVQNLYYGNRPGPRRVNIAIDGDPFTDMPGGERESFFNVNRTGFPLSWDFFNEWGWLPGDSAWAWLDQTDITDTGSVYFRLTYREDVGAPYRNFVTRFAVSGTDGFVPEKYRVANVSGTLGLTVKEGTFGMGEGIATLEWSGDWNDVSTIVRIDFIGATDTWREFVEQTRINEIQSMTHRFITSRAHVTGLPGDVLLWDETPIPYRSIVPPTEYTTWSQDTGEVCVYELPGTGTRALVQIRAPLDLFDTVVFKPPYGVPVIESVIADELYGGETGDIVAVVKNDGYTGDTFYPSLDIPDGVTKRILPGGLYVEAGASEEFRWTVGLGGLETGYTARGSLTITASGSKITTDPYYFDMVLHASPLPPHKTGDLSVAVIDVDRIPIVGAEVSVSGMEGVTGSTGSVVMYDLSVGTHTVTVSAEGYASVSKDVSISEGMNQVTISLGPPAPEIPWVLIIGVLVVIVVVIVVVYILYKKGKLRR